jgi:hypothetical protein
VSAAAAGTRVPTRIFVFIGGRNIARNARALMLLAVSLAQPLAWLALFSQTFRGLAADPAFRAQGYHDYLTFFTPSPAGCRPSPGPTRRLRDHHRPGAAELRLPAGPAGRDDHRPRRSRSSAGPRHGGILAIDQGVIRHVRHRGPLRRERLQGRAMVRLGMAARPWFPRPAPGNSLVRRRAETLTTKGGPGSQA